MMVHLCRNLRLRCWLASAPALSLTMMVGAAVAVLAFHLLRKSEPTVRYFNCVAPEVANSVARLHRDQEEADYLVPNTVHMYVPLSEGEGLTAAGVAGLVSVYRRQAPDAVVLHTDKPQQLRERLEVLGVSGEEGLREVLRVQHWPTPRHVFGLPFSDRDRLQHISDLVRLRILRLYGGIFIDVGVSLTTDVNHIRSHDLVVFRGEGGGSGVDNRVILAHRDSPVLLAWIRSYTHYDPGYPRHHWTTLVNRLLNGEGRGTSLLVVNSENVFTAS